MARLSAEGRHGEAHDLFDARLPLIRYEQQPGAGLAARRHVLMRRAVPASDARSVSRPAAPLTAAARAEGDHLLARPARRDPRARI